MQPLISPSRLFKYSITFQETTQDSREVSDFSDSGYIIENETDTIGNILKKANEVYGIYYPISFGGWESTYPEQDRDYFEKGIEKYYALFIKNEDGTDITTEEYDFITYLLSNGQYNSEEFQEYAVGGLIAGAVGLGVAGLIGYYYFDKEKKNSKIKKQNAEPDYEIINDNKKQSKKSNQKYVTHIVKGKERKYPIGSAWTKEHYNDNDDENYEIEPSKRNPKHRARNRQYENGGGVGQLPPKGELTNKQNLLLKYQKKGSEYEFYIYEPVTKNISAYQQNKYLCKNKDCPIKMPYNQFINYLYTETYLDDLEYANGGGVGKYQVYYMDNDRRKVVLATGLTYMSAVKLSQKYYSQGLSTEYEMIFANGGGVESEHLENALNMLNYYLKEKGSRINFNEIKKEIELSKNENIIELANKISIGTHTKTTDFSDLYYSIKGVLRNQYGKQYANGGGVEMNQPTITPTTPKTPTTPTTPKTPYRPKIKPRPKANKYDFILIKK